MRVARGLFPIAVVLGLVSGCGEAERHPVEGDARRLISIEPIPERGRVGEPVRLLVTVYDLDGVRRPGERVSIGSSRSDDALTEREGVTDAAGEFAATLIASAAGRREITAHVGGSKGVIALSIERADEPSACTGGVLVGGYAPVEPLPGESSTSLLAAGDFDGDGACEAAFVSDEWSAERSTRLTTDGSSDWPVVKDLMGAGMLPLAVATGDFDGDGMTDLAVAGAVAGWASFRVEWFSADGDRVWRRIGGLDVPDGFHRLVAVDIDGDGRTDLLGESNVSVLRVVLMGDDGPVLGDEMPLQSGGKRLLTWEAGDFDGDGKADIAVATHREIETHKGAGDGTFFPGETLDFRPDSAVNQLVAADLDGDGLDDLAAIERSDFGETFPTIYRGRPDGSFEKVRVAGEATGRLTTGDVDGDGVADLVIRRGSWDGTELLVVRGDREGRFASAEPLLMLPLQPRAMSICAGAAGRPEIVVLGPTAWARIPVEASAPGMVDGYSRWIGGVVGDPTDDGSVEIVAVDPEGGGRRIAIDAAGDTHEVQAFEIARELPWSDFRAVGRVGDETVGSVVEVGFKEPGHAIIVHSLSAGTSRQVATSADPVLSVAIADVDDDGLKDIVVGTTIETIALVADEKGDFRTVRVAEFAAWAIAAGDIDGDGAVELILAGWPEIVAVSLRASFSPPEPLPLGSFGTDRILVTGDFDGDGKDDVAIAGTNESILSVHLHAAEDRFGPALDFGVGGPIVAGAYGRLAGGSERGFVFLTGESLARVVPISCTEP